MDSSLSLLQEIFAERAPAFVGQVRNLRSIDIPEDKRQAMIDLLTDEFAASGINSITGEPNDRGLAIETLIDYFIVAQK